MGSEQRWFCDWCFRKIKGSDDVASYSSSLWEPSNGKQGKDFAKTVDINDLELCQSCAGVVKTAHEVLSRCLNGRNVADQAIPELLKNLTTAIEEARNVC